MKYSFFEESEFLSSPFPLIETHCHLDYLKRFSLEQTLALSKKLGVEKIMTISVSVSNIEEVLNLKLKSESIFPTLGIHPNHSEEWNENLLKRLHSLLENHKEQKTVVALGEMGLDFYRLEQEENPEEAKRKQCECFLSQLELACEFNLPIVVHSRQAEKETVACLEKYKNKLQGGVVHSFTSSLEMAKKCVDLGLKIGVNGIISFKNASELQQTIQSLSLENIILETDAPYLSPSPFRGEENGPYFLPAVAKALYQLLKKKENFSTLSEEKFLEQIYFNSLEAFPLLKQN